LLVEGAGKMLAVQCSMTTDGLSETSQAACSRSVEPPSSADAIYWETKILESVNPIWGSLQITARNILLPVLMEI
jgi:hypothetical protein